MSDGKKVAPGFELQEHPSIICTTLPGNWLLDHTTPSWRIKDPHEGFQRMVREQRAREVALAVLDQRRTFPNAIVLATDVDSIETDSDSGRVTIPEGILFLVVDGQHRLWAQRYSEYNASYACLIHAGLTVEQMADLFLEINDNQKRVPSSLRWDLVRLVRPVDDQVGLSAAEIVYLLATENGSPFFQRIDLTGEQSELQIKQGSLAPEFKLLLSGRSPMRHLDFQRAYDTILEYSIAISQVDADRWGHPESSFFKARVLRAMFKLLPDLFTKLGDEPTNAQAFIPWLTRIDEKSLNPDTIRAVQGSAGIRAIYNSLKSQVFQTQEAS